MDAPEEGATPGPLVTWTLVHRGQLVARLVVTGMDQPWMQAEVVPEPVFQELRWIFKEDLRLLKALDDGEAAPARYEEFLDAQEGQFDLVRPDGVAVPEFLLHIDGDAAWWRWSDTPFS